jgi:hypothetical protein
MLVWTKNPANQLSGTGAIGSATNDWVFGSKWDPVSSVWGQGAVLVPNLSGRNSQSLAGCWRARSVRMVAQDRLGNDGQSVSRQI